VRAEWFCGHQGGAKAKGPSGTQRARPPSSSRTGDGWLGPGVPIGRIRGRAEGNIYIG
jgi:hypothetical protein